MGKGIQVSKPPIQCTFCIPTEPLIMMAFSWEWKSPFHWLPLWNWLTLSFQSQILSQRDHRPPSSSEQPLEKKKHNTKLPSSKVTTNLLTSFFSLAKFPAKSKISYQNRKCWGVVFFSLCNFWFYKIKMCSHKYFHPGIHPCQTQKVLHIKYRTRAPQWEVKISSRGFFKDTVQQHALSMNKCCTRDSKYTCLVCMACFLFNTRKSLKINTRAYQAERFSLSFWLKHIHKFHFFLVFVCFYIFSYCIKWLL